MTCPFLPIILLLLLFHCFSFDFNVHWELLKGDVISSEQLINSQFWGNLCNKIEINKENIGSLGSTAHTQDWPLIVGDGATHDNECVLSQTFCSHDKTLFEDLVGYDPHNF